MDTVHWPQGCVSQPQEIGLVKPMEEVVVPISTLSNSSSSTTRGQERRVRPQKEQALNCPRCNSTNTKFCYYNNYSLTQPRYFCKTCRRYWTEGGSLRNVPVGGGSRKNKRSSSSSSTIASSSLNLNTQNPNKCPESNEFPILDHTSNPSSTSALELLRRGMMLGPVLEPGSAYPPGFGLQEFRSPHTLSFPLDHGAMQGVQESSSGGLLFPFEDLRQVPSSGSAAADHDFEQNGGQGEHPPGFWNQIMGSGGSW